MKILALYLFVWIILSSFSCLVNYLVASFTYAVTIWTTSRYFTTPVTETEKAQQDDLFKKILDESSTFHFWNSLTSTFIPEPESLATRLLNYYCIHCFDVLWILHKISYLLSWNDEIRGNTFDDIPKPLWLEIWISYVAEEQSILL